MKGLVVYQSYYGNTKQVAEAVADECRKSGHSAEAQEVKAKLPDPKAFDFVFVGAPTRMGRGGGKVKRVLKRLVKRGCTKNPVVIFDTCAVLPADPKEREKSLPWVEPGAAGRLHALALRLGLNVYPKTLRCEVTGMKGPLGAQELEKARAFAREFLSGLKG